MPTKFTTADGRTLDPRTQPNASICFSPLHPDLPFASASVAVEHFGAAIKSLKFMRLDDYLHRQEQERRWTKE